jgi:prevent-host-death family protein
VAKWSVAEAKAKLSEVLSRARQEPQVIESRGRPMAVVVSVEGYEQLKAIEEQGLPTPMQDFLTRCQAMRARGELELDLAPRQVEPERTTPFEET